MYKTCLDILCSPLYEEAKLEMMEDTTNKVTDPSSTDDDTAAASTDAGVQETKPRAQVRYL